MSRYPSTCGSLASHDCDPCAPREYGRVRSFCFISQDIYPTLIANITDTPTWQAAIAARQVVVIPYSNGSVPMASPKMGPGFGSAVETPLGYDFTAKVVDPNYANNVAFYNSIFGAKGYHLGYLTSSKLAITDNTVTIIPNKDIKDDLNSGVYWEIECKWADHKHELLYPIPSGVFDACYE